MKKTTLYMRNLLVAFDRMVNTILGGDPAMTVSGRVGRDAAVPNKCAFCRWLCAFLDWVDADHCKRMAAREAPLGADEIIK